MEERSKSLKVPSNRVPNLAKPTLSASIKKKCVMFSRHRELTTNRFLPVNSSEAKQTVQKEIIHYDGEPHRADIESMQRSTMIMKSIHGDSIFRKTSPMTRDRL